MTKDIRLRNGSLQTAIHEFTHKGSTAKFTLIAVSHVAEHAYWDSVMGEMEERDHRGAEIHYELVDNDIKIKGGPKKHPYEVLADYIGLQTQFKGLKLAEHWHNTDMTMGELLSAADDPQSMWAALNKTNDIEEVLKDGVIPPKLLRWVMIHMLRVSSLIPISRNRNISSVLKDGRTDFAMNKMLDRNVDVVTVWGGSHVSRMRRLLKKSGYVLTGTRWLTAVEKTVSGTIESR